MYGEEDRCTQGSGFSSLKETLGRPRHRWEDNVKMDLQEVGCGGLDWIDVTQYTDRWWVLVTTVLNLS